MTAKIEEKIVNFVLDNINGKMRGWLFCIVMIITGCSEPTVPEEYLSEPEMASIILDIYIAEGELAFSNLKYPSETIFPVYKELLLDSHGITDSVYTANITFYLANPTLLDKVYDIVIDSMKIRRQAIP